MDAAVRHSTERTAARPHPSMAMTAPRGDTPMSANPRRTPADRSVSLLHKQKSRAQHMGVSSSETRHDQDSHLGDDSIPTNSPSSLQALRGSNRSGETSNAENWFEKYNNDVQHAGPSSADNDPPFLMRNQSSEETPLDVQQQVGRLHDIRAASLSFRTGLLQQDTGGSSTEDYRGVIDDLTVENTKLKRKLKKYEKLHDKHLEDDKLFEIRIHGLSAEKKRELEETLRNFAFSSGASEANTFPDQEYSSPSPILKNPEAVSSHNEDSAYASMSASGPGSLAQSGNGNQQHVTPPQYLANGSQNIQSYLHDIPKGLLLGQNPTTMSEQAKKQLVVQTLERLFSGRGTATGRHQQSLQQQELSQTAANYDQSAMQAIGERTNSEGSIEARIMRHETEDPLESKRGQKERSVELGSEHQSEDLIHSSNRSLVEQRPTRPLDLDSRRAQTPAENVQYMRRLGFSPLDPELGGMVEDGHGWIYLNFLINMAQLHTINVTTDFIRQALSDHSNQIELSEDGRKLRWKGSSAVIRNGSSGEGSPDSYAGGDKQESPRKRPKLAHGVDRHSMGTPIVRSGNVLPRQSESNMHAYTPVFTHKDSTDDSDSSSSEEEESDHASPLVPTPVACGHSAMTSHGIQTSFGANRATSMRKRQSRDEGPIVFYNNAQFCTDLSGDQDPDSKPHAPAYIPATGFPVGSQQTKRGRLLTRREPLAAAAEFPEPMYLYDNAILHSEELVYPPRSPPPAKPLQSQRPVDFEATGIGGVWPADNFAVWVDTSHARLGWQHASALSEATALNSFTPLLAQALDDLRRKRKLRAPFGRHVLSSKFQQLPPSELPPALGLGSLSEDDSDGESDNDTSDTSDSPAAFLPSTAPQPVDMTFEPSEGEHGDDSDGYEESDDGEIDLLAAARQIAPEAIRAKEREYDANMAERLAEEIPMGSSAATAGGGSGFVSPATGFNRDKSQRAVRDAHSAALQSRWERSRDSMVLHMKDDSNDDDSHGEMSDVRS